MSQTGIRWRRTTLGAAAASLSAALGLHAQPLIVTQPANQQAHFGATASFTVTAVTHGITSYQWQANGTNLPTYTAATLLAGTGAAGYSGDGGFARNATLNSPAALAWDSAGGLYIADYGNHCVRRVDTNGMILTVAGTGTAGSSGDGGPAVAAGLRFPQGVALDAAGNLYIADTGNSLIRRVTPAGMITTVAGNGTPAYAGDDGPATNASLAYAAGVAVDSAGNLFIADTGNNCIRKVGLDGTITRVAGSGTNGYSGDGGPATTASLSAPEAVAVGPAGQLYVADSANNCLRKVGANRVIATPAENLNWPSGVALDAAGNVYVAEFAGDFIFALDTNNLPWGGLALSTPSAVAVDAWGDVAVACADAASNVVLTVAYHGQPTLFLTNVSLANAGGYRVIVTDAFGSVTSQVATLTLLAGSQSSAADWPRFRGPDLAGTSPDPLLRSWPTGGLAVAWSFPSPGGYGSCAVSGGVLFALVNLPVSWPSQEWCMAVDVVSGDQVWATRLGTACADSTPTVQDGRVYAYAGNCTLNCLDAQTGTLLWTRNLINEFGGRSVDYGNSQSPWVEDGRVFVAMNAATNCLMAFNATNGALLWQTGSDTLTYASPVAATIQGVRQLIFKSPNALVAVAPDTGRQLWRYPQAQVFQQGCSPVVQGDVVVCASGENVEAIWIVAFNGGFLPTPLWVNSFSEDLLYATLVVQDQQLYGLFGDTLECLDLATGAVNWQTSPLTWGSGSLILVDQCLVVMDGSGQLILANATPAGYQELGRSPSRPQSIFLNSPAFWNGRLFARDPYELVCFDARPPARLQVSATLPAVGQLRLSVACADGTALSAARAAGIRLCCASDPSQPLSRWTVLEGAPVSSSGSDWSWQVPVPAGEPARFYAAVEPAP